jgi:hypothetical protein
MPALTIAAPRSCPAAAQGRGAAIEVLPWLAGDGAPGMSCRSPVQASIPAGHPSMHFWLLSAASMPHRRVDRATEFQCVAVDRPDLGSGWHGE